jgi:DNA-binding NarL/FixJ family response regulator
MDGWETARRIRASGVVDMPIIMVSANAFENRPEKLAEAGAQAFVDKPVIESELLVALQRHLQLEWVAELPRATWTPPLAAPAAALPAEFASALTRLARIGHAQGLQQALDRLAREQPASLEAVAALRAMVDRFAFGELLDALAPALDAADAQAR